MVQGWNMTLVKAQLWAYYMSNLCSCIGALQETGLNATSQKYDRSLHLRGYTQFISELLVDWHTRIFLRAMNKGVLN